MLNIDDNYLDIVYPIVLQLEEIISCLLTFKNNDFSFKDNDKGLSRLVNIINKFDRIHEDARKAIYKYLSNCGYKVTGDNNQL